MSNLSPEETFWIEQPGARISDEVRGNLEVREAASEAGSQDEKSWDDDPIIQATQAAADEVRGREDDKGDWNSSKEHREWLTERYPGTKLEDYGRNMLGWHQYFQRDPANAKEAWIRHWASRPPFHPRASAKPQKEEAPSDWWAEGKREYALNQDVKNAVRSAARNREDDNEFENTSQLRQLLRQNGITLSQFLDKCRAIENASLDDPAGVAQRFAVFSGMPATERQAQELQAAVQQAQEIAGQRSAAADDIVTQMGVNALPEQIQERMSDFINQVPRDIIQDIRHWPYVLQKAEQCARTELQLEKENLANEVINEFASDPAHKYYASLENDIANLLTSGVVQRTGDMRADLKTAYNMAVRANPTIAAERARRASRSIHGAPSPGAGARSGSSGNSVEDDVRRAFYGGTI